MAVLSPDGSTSRLFTVALLSASASAALTYAALRFRSLLQDKKRSLAEGHKYSDHSTCCATPPTKRDPYDPSPRSGYLSWDDYFMAVAFLSAQRSKDPNKQVGACIVDQSQVICGIGYNGFPRGCADSALPWAKKARGGDPLGTKYPYVCHAEMNALLNKNGASVAGAKIYVTLFPCNECAKLLIQAGISEIVYHEDKLAHRRPPSPSKDGFRPDQQYAASRKLLALAGVKLRQHRFRHPVTLRLTNHPAYPIVRSMDSAVVAAEAAAAAKGAAAAGGENGGLANGRYPYGAAAAAPGGAPSGGSPWQAREPSHVEMAAAAAAAAAATTAAVMAALQPLAPDLHGGVSAAADAVGGCASPLLTALSRYRQLLAGAAAAAAGTAGESTPRGTPRGSSTPSPEEGVLGGGAGASCVAAGAAAASASDVGEAGTVAGSAGAAATAAAHGQQQQQRGAAAAAWEERTAGEGEEEQEELRRSASSSGAWEPAADENIGLA